MKFHPIQLAGAYLIELDTIADDRGHFARTFCEHEFSRHGLNTQFVQANVSFNREAGTLRGMHYQLPPHAETKLVRCSRGSILDVIVDMRPDSSTLGQSYRVELSSTNHRMLYVPKGFAHGFQTLTDDVEVSYQMSDFYEPSASRGFRFDDPDIAIEWPLAITQISERDRQLPRWSEQLPQSIEWAKCGGETK
ncbi:MAG: dTDP-4-dehydrorhamnose 3,5-epimerase [Planctomycetota bacterium]